VRVQKTAAQMIDSTTSVLTPLTWDVAIYDTGGFYNPATPDVLTAPEDGVYAIDGGVRWAHNPLGTRFAGICVNGPSVGGCNVDTDVAVSQYATNDDPGIGSTRLTQQTVSTQVKLVTGDVVQLVVVQNSGGPLSVDQWAATNLAMVKIGEG
jgi:hypothetical protein